ncbi:class I glutamine amidotransferase-like protein [Jaminaea rosea]|uniref:D-lactate dehydratase n=1 Tax=Jaminaea rosea TaxID=1569628 RepID=A0A316UVJ5_9BASI|nr:class I glutamine amidotransferase-like protein [Jaminaea rosea]PWN28818.1 class I glutamine amidotransferase-like protein [Jaminaea rosea]
MVADKKPILVVITSHTKLIGKDHPTGWYLPELAHPAYHFKREGYPMIFASPKGGEAPLDQSSVEAFKEDKESQEFLKDEEFQQMVKNTKKLSEIDTDVSKYSAIFYPGGHGPCFDLPVDATSQKLIKDFYEAKMPVSAVCHAPAVFSDVKLSNGKYLLETRKVTSFSNEEEEMAQLTDAIPWLVETRLGERGGMYSKAKVPFGEHVVVDESGDGHTLITGQNPASASAMAKELTKALQK